MDWMQIGLVVLFVLLVVISFIVRGYGADLRNLQEKVKDVKAVPEPFMPIKKSAAEPLAQDGIPEEVVAAIAAAVYTLYGSSAGKITSIRRAAQPNRSEWKMAGLLEKTRPF